MKTSILMERGEWLRSQCCIHFPPSHFNYLIWSDLLIFTSALHFSKRLYVLSATAVGKCLLFIRIWMFQLRLTPRKYCSQILLANIAHKYCWKSGTACECLNCRSTFPIDVKMLKDMTLHRVSGIRWTHALGTLQHARTLMAWQAYCADMRIKTIDYGSVFPAIVHFWLSR